MGELGVSQLRGPDEANSDAHRLEGQQIGRYLVQRQLGSGGGASVYQAYDQVLGQTVALKVLPPNPDPATLDRFRREALMAGALRHPHIVRILQVGVAANGGPGYIAMVLVDGESLADLLARFGSLRAEESCNLLEPVARALAFAHGYGVIHRDVKPSNILLRVASPGAAHSVQLEALEHPVTPLLSDFGVARFLDAPELTNLGRTVGTPAFMAPEQCTGERDVDGRADIYALGTVLYRSVIGRIPFAGTTTKILHAHVYDPVTIAPEAAERLPESVLAILQRCLAKPPRDRYQDATELAEALAQVAGRGQPTRSASLATATLTLASLPRVAGSRPSPAMRSGALVLVAGAPPAAEDGPVVTVRPPVGSWRAPGWLLWATGVLLAALLGAVIGARLMNGDARNATDAPTATLAVLASGGPEAIASLTQPTPLPVANATAVLSYTIVHPAATLLPTATLPPTPSPRPSATPQPPPTPAPVDDVAPKAAARPLAITPTLPFAPEGEPVVLGGCNYVVDEFFTAALSEQVNPLAAELGCPTGRATDSPGAWQRFERGVVVAPNGSAVVYIYYAATHEWEQVARPSPGEGPPDQSDLPSGSFDAILQVEARRQALGAPLIADAQTVAVVVQPFAEGLLMGNREEGTAVILARSKLHF